MLVILLDAAVILGLVYLFNEGEVPGWGTAIATAVAISFGFLGCAHFLGPIIGFFALFPMAAVAALVLCIACDRRLKQALYAGLILFLYKIVFWIILLAMFPE
jgi:hypothetical protein